MTSTEEHEPAAEERPARIPPELKQRAEARKAQKPQSAKSPTGPAPGRIIAAAASVSVGIGLVALMAGGSAQPDTIIEVNPTPVVVQPATVVIEQVGAANSSTAAPTVRVIEAATPAVPAQAEPTPAPKAQPVTQSQGS